jgi:toxin CptA
MSIAVSAVVRPSRCLRALVAAYGLSNVAAAAAAGLLLPDRFACAPASAAFLLCAGGFLLHSCATLTKTRRIDISGVGQLRLTVQQEMRTRVATDGVLIDAEVSGAPVVLLPGTTIWPGVMLLRLGAEHGAVTLLPVLHDSVAPGEFRALAVALGAIGGRNKSLQGKRKIR